MLPRLQAMLDRRDSDETDPTYVRRMEDVDELVTVLRVCVDKDVELIFG
ncbi:hypothetical protein [Streptomyces bauhiniae]